MSLVLPPLSEARRLSYQLTRPPRDDDELYSLVKALWGVTIPRDKHCAHHQAPFDAFATAFFAREPQVLVKGSRGLSGKSQLMSVLGITQAVVWGADNNIVGGSENQSKNVLEHIRKAWEHDGAPKQMIKKDAITEMQLTNNALIRPLTASQKSVRGPHPARLLLDEIDEMDPEILESAKGQPMPQKNWMGVIIPQQTIMVSTLQYADKAMMQEIRRFEEEGLPYYEWCIASGELVTTERGEVPIESVRADDRVLTRRGWKAVQHVTYMGFKPVVTVTLADGRSLVCTPDHRLASSGGWVTADSALTVTTVGSDVPVALSTCGACGRRLLHKPASSRVLAGSSDLKMFSAYTDGPHTEMIDVFGGVGENDSTAGLHDEPCDCAVGPLAVDLDALHAVAVAGSSGPVDAIHTDESTVVSIETSGHAHVWDIGVEEEHEFIVNGMVVHNCYKDTCYAKDGWLSEEFVEQKKREVSRERWRVEYELGEPSIGNRAIDSQAVEEMFDTKEYETVSYSRDHQEYKLEDPRDDRDYVIAADWAQAVDWTAITVWDVTTDPIRCVYIVRMQRKPYPVMVGKFNTLQKKYNRASGIHDATGLGRVVADLIDGEVRNFIMAGRERDDMLSEFVAAVERGQIKSPRYPEMYKEILYASTEDLYSRAKEHHLPDTFCSAALAWKMVSHRFPPVEPWGAQRTDMNWMGKQVDQGKEHVADNSQWRPEGQVKKQEDSWNEITLV